MPPHPLLSNPHLELHLAVPDGGWSLFHQGSLTPSVEGVQTGLGFRWKKQPAHLAVSVKDISPADNVVAPTHCGDLRGLRATGVPLPIGIVVDAEFALAEDGAFLLWRLIARNEGRHTIALETLELARLGPAFRLKPPARQRFGGLLKRPEAELRPPPAGCLRLADGPGDMTFFANGYQSWSFAGTLTAQERMPRSMFGPLGDPKHLNLITPRPRQPGQFTSEMFGLIADRRHASGLVVGFLSQKQQFGTIEVVLDDYAPSLRVRAQCDGLPLAPGTEVRTDWAYLEFVDTSQLDPLAGYLEAAARENGARVPADTPKGWCSWYQYFGKVTEHDILANTAAVAKNRDRLPLNLVQIDDGYEQHVGDWLETNGKFPHGLGWLAEQTRAQGLTPGLWLAPFIAISSSKLVREHPDWFIHTASGGLANAGLNWGKRCYGLDPTHPSARDYVHGLIRAAVREWGFPYLKLDFLYAAALPGRRYDPTLTRAQALRRGLELIREAAGPNTFILGCGCPLGSAIGIVDGMRIGTDVDPHWHPFLLHPALSPLMRTDEAFVSTRNSIRNTLTRAPLHRRWWLNDPDCLLVCEAHNSLTRDEVLALATVIALSGGMFLVSDDLTSLSPDRRAILEPLLPVIGQTALARDWLDQRMPEQFALPLSGSVGGWTLVGLFNWSDRAADRQLDLSDLGLPSAEQYHVFDFWNRRYRSAPPGALQFSTPAHGGRLLAIRPRASAPQFVASTLHFSQGREIRTWVVDANRLSAEIKLALVVCHAAEWSDATGHSAAQLPARGNSYEIELGRVADGELWLSLPASPVYAEVGGRPVTPIQVSEQVWTVPVRVNGTTEIVVGWI